MGSQVQGSNDRSRTYWTPSMERYFVDLMLEHMHKGNRVGHTFNKQAWTDMLTVFNAKFGSTYDKDVLKSRYTNLWKQFNDVKNMLGQGGFAWDEVRCMVVADDYVWEDYLKVCPDARTYKTKSVQNFSDLCLIYGYTTADGRYSRSSHDVDIEDEVNVANLGDGLGSPAPLNIERPKTDWTLDMDQFLTELLVLQLEKGNKLDNNNACCREAWTEILTSFGAKYGAHHTKRVLRHRYKKLFKYYTDVMVLLKQQGFSWDEREQKAHPQARSYRSKSIPNYKHLELIFGTVVTDGTINHDLDKYLDDYVAGPKAGGERSRTHWTPPMDRYLIDLLVDHVNKGNRIGKTFVAQAWIDIVKSFNANFSSNHDKDVLKNRFKHLKRQYNDVNTLLMEPGFSWDDAREMVVAEDHIWDAYIETHTDARCYRVKTVPNYHKLCLIYGQNNTEGRYSHLARNATVSSLDEGSNSWIISEAKENTDWTPEMDECFIELMLNKQMGNKIDNSFDEQIWTEITTLFNERCKLQYDNRALQDRFSYFMKQFNDVENLLNQNGFYWDDPCQMVVANDDVWDAYSKEHPYTTSYKGTVLKHRKDLCVIFGGGSFEKSTTKSDSQLGIETQETDISNKKKRVKKFSLDSGRSSKVQRNNSDDMKEALTDMANVVSKLVNAKTDKNYSAIEKAVDALQAISDIDDDLLLDGCDILEDEKKAKTFLALDASLRKKWLLRKLGR
ncbi:uncharacterized protein [Rutidosis leptorrhynchoides]|uniref:uncharacterized protein isoform X2 n=1 Tax=Rutidosis leptorrhynchoides TaxID=125765 RepID=UPI003A99D405